MLAPTIDNINAILKLYIKDPVGQKMLREDWRKIITSHFEMNDEQKKNMTSNNLPKDRLEAIHKAVDEVLEFGGSIRLSGVSPTTLVIRPTDPRPRFACTIATSSFYCHVNTK